MKDKFYFMKAALKEAKKAYDEGEVPIGAVIVCEQKIIARAHNEREKKNLATAHAEITCIEKACRKLKSWRLDDCEIYITVEPCPMCAGAILNARIKKAYYGAKDLKGGAAESNFSVLSSGVLNWTTESEGGVLDKEAEKLLKDFFVERRRS